jgi:hypothetical protein
MSSHQIDASQMPSQSWSIVAQPSLRSRAASSLPEAPPIRTESPVASEAAIRPASLSLDAQLFENSAELKIALSQIVMHLEPEWRTIIFRQLDALLDLNSWEEDSAFIQKSTFMTFLRFIIYAAPTRLPSLGVGYTGHILAAWNNGAQRIDVEFLPDDNAGATFVREGAHSTETLAWRGHAADLKSFIERNGMIECIESDAV